MAPGETIWFGGPVLPDYAAGPPALAAVLIHELTHCAQHQAGMSLVPRGLWAHSVAAVRGQHAYGYDPSPRPLAGRPFEHQAAILEDAYRALHGLPPRWSGANLTALLAILGHRPPDPASRTASFSLGAPPLLNTPLR